MREYLSVAEASSAIANEVVQTGASVGWGEVDQNTLGIAIDVEKKLRDFNIGYVNSKKGGWTKQKNGSRYFSGLKWFGFAKTKLASAISAIKKWSVPFAKDQTKIVNGKKPPIMGRKLFVIPVLANEIKRICEWKNALSFISEAMVFWQIGPRPSLLGLKKKPISENVLLFLFFMKRGGGGALFIKIFRTEFIVVRLRKKNLLKGKLNMVKYSARMVCSLIGSYVGAKLGIKLVNLVFDKVIGS